MSRYTGLTRTEYTCDACGRTAASADVPAGWFHKGDYHRCLACRRQDSDDPGVCEHCGSDVGRDQCTVCGKVNDRRIRSIW